MNNIFEKKEGELIKPFLSCLEEEAWSFFRSHDLGEEHLLYEEVPEKATFEYKDKQYKFITYATNVEKLDYIIPAFKYMIDSFYKNTSKKDLVVVRQTPRIRLDSLGTGVFYLSFRAVVIPNE